MIMDLYISPDIVKKLKDKHAVEVHEVHEIWGRYNGMTLEDNREDHKTDPATEWFISRTNVRRVLKVVFVPREDVGPKGTAFLRSCYPPNQNETGIFKRRGGVI